YYVADFRDFAISKGIDVDAIAPLVDGKFISAFVRASKPLNS
ncbi:MAG: arsenite S-adenosylmethyltransferase, partial [Blastocatellia bacterium]|nr:arsenite S-adenosylmethyltransferase [Blastocatellia bacterium]